MATGRTRIDGTPDRRYTKSLPTFKVAGKPLAWDNVKTELPSVPVGGGGAKEGKQPKQAEQEQEEVEEVEQEQQQETTPPKGKEKKQFKIKPPKLPQQIMMEPVENPPPLHGYQLMKTDNNEHVYVELSGRLENVLESSKAEEEFWEMMLGSLNKKAEEGEKKAEQRQQASSSSSSQQAQPIHQPSHQEAPSQAPSTRSEPVAERPLMDQYNG